MIPSTQPERFGTMIARTFTLQRGAQVMSSATILVLALSGVVSAQERTPAPLIAKEANSYCVNIADAAADARFAWQKETLASLEKELEARIKVLEEKRAEYETWLKRRNEFLEKADETIVSIYSRMKPEAAAQQLVNMNEETAAAILMKLNPRAASSVLNEMEPARAALLTGIITDAARRSQDNEKS